MFELYVNLLTVKFVGEESLRNFARYGSRKFSMLDLHVMQASGVGSFSVFRMHLYD